MSKQPQMSSEYHLRDPYMQVNKVCNICTSSFETDAKLQEHFVACMGRNGNPAAAWGNDSSASTTSAAASSRAPNSFALPSRPFVKTAEQRAARLQRDADRLAAVNGVVIPSRLKPGQPPLQIDSVSSEGRIYPCTVCRKKFARKLHVRSHFATCVRNNGNPTGARWDDAWTIRPYAPPGMRVPSAGGPLGGDSSVRDNSSHNLQMIDSHPTTTLPPPASQSPDFQHSEPELTNIHLDAIQHYSPIASVPHLASPEPFTLATDNIPIETTPKPGLRKDHLIQDGQHPYDASLRMDILTDDALLAMLDAWQDFMQETGENHTSHPHFRRIVSELEKRGRTVVVMEG